MTDERLADSLAEFGMAKLSPEADRRIRLRIEEEWQALAPRGAAWHGLTRILAPAAAVALTGALGSAALGASADSPLWGTRVALEDIGLQLRITADARADYLSDLIDARTAEAAHQEAVGNALAAGRALAAREAAIARFKGEAPKAEPPRTLPPVAQVPDHTRSPEPTRTPEPSAPPTTPDLATRTPEPTSTPGPTRTASPTRTPEPTRTPAPTDPPTVAILITGTVRYEDGTPVGRACITTTATPTFTTCSVNAENGVFTINNTRAIPGQQVRLYAIATERGYYVGSEATTLVAPTTTFPTITVHLQPLPSSTPTPVPTATPVPSATPAPSATPRTTIVSGTVRYEDGTAPARACITTNPNTDPLGCGIYAVNGVFSFSSTVSPGQQIRLYAIGTDRTGWWIGAESTTVTTVGTATFPPITLRLTATPTPAPTPTPTPR